jgi:hypothetical protein
MDYLKLYRDCEMSVGNKFNHLKLSYRDCGVKYKVERTFY